MAHTYAIPLLPGLLALVAVLGCSRDDSALGVDPNSASTAAASGSGGGGGEGAGGAAGAGGVPIEPPGPTKLTVVNGIVDQDAVRICFLAHPDTGQVVTPWPTDSTGLPFAASRTIDLTGSVIPAGADVRLHVIAGDLQAIAGKTCAQAFALAEAGGGTGGTGGGGGSVAAPVTVAALAVIPASVFMTPKSLLLVPHGCMGGASHSDPVEMTVCGPGYSATTPTAGLVAAGMSRITTPDAIALQAVHASAAMPAVDVRITPGIGGALERQLATKLTLGAIGPFPPFMELSLADYGALLQTQLKTYAPLGPTATSTILMEEVLTASTISQTEFADGNGFALVAVGAAPGVAAGPWWRTFSYTLVRADP